MGAARVKRSTSSGADTLRRYAEDATDAELVRIPLDRIADRPAGDTRPLNEAQVASLVESIAAVGLIAPLAVDCRNRLLAGGHRRAALQRLLEQDEPRFNDLFPGGVPCRKFDFDSETEQAQALTIEISENEKRRNYTRAEIVAVARKLEGQGYSLERGRGNIKPLTPALQVALGVSRRTVQRALAESNAPPGAFEGPRMRSISLPADLVDRLRAIAAEQNKALTELLWEMSLSYRQEP